MFAISLPATISGRNENIILICADYLDEAASFRLHAVVKATGEGRVCDELVGVSSVVGRRK